MHFIVLEEDKVGDTIQTVLQSLSMVHFMHLSNQLTSKDEECVDFYPVKFATGEIPISDENKKL